MESNIINWIHNSNELLSGILFILSNNGFYISKSSLRKLCKSPNKITSDKSEEITLFDLDFIKDRVKEECRLCPGCTLYELIPKKSNNYFDKKIPLELSHIISSSQYIEFIQSINSYIIIKNKIKTFNKKLIFQMNYNEFHKFIEFKLIRKKKKFIQTNDKITMEFVYYPRNSINNNNNNSINEYTL
ncbi:hypothetical protein RB653_009227 [Dictyostelium firmibasis]|uniref:Uncharacterized protein n=1 Tax=Dictyostelium firmibasis TaxID=79012 RepID=A0AAN7UDX5_9MYCE